MRHLEARISRLESASLAAPSYIETLRALAASLDEVETLATRGAPAHPLTPAREHMLHELAALGVLTDDPTEARDWLARAHAELARFDDAHRP